MKDENVYRIQFPVFPFTDKLPVPSVPPNDLETQICVSFSYRWLPILLGLVKVMLYTDMWVDGGELSTSYVNQLIKLLITPVPCEGSVMGVDIRIIDVGGGCQQVQKSINGGAWVNIGAPICNGTNGTNAQEIELFSIDLLDGCFDLRWRYVGGEDTYFLATICNGEKGDTGDTGECDCPDPTDPVTTQPVIEPGEDRCVTACNIAFGLGAYFFQKFIDTLNWAEAAFEATDIVADLVSDFVEAFPVLGAVVDAVVQYVENWSEKDLAALRGANTEEFKEMMQCKLYEFMADDAGDFTAEYLSGIRNELLSYMAVLPPQGPLLVVIGQAYAAMLALFSPNDLLKRANIYKDNDGECDLCDVECDECPNPALIHIRCDINSEYLEPGWNICTSPSPSITSYGDRNSATVTLPDTLLVQSIAITWRSAFTPNAPITGGHIIFNGEDHFQALSGLGSSTTAQNVTNIMQEISSFELRTDGGVNSSNPSGYVAFFDLVVHYCVPDAP